MAELNYKFSIYVSAQYLFANMHKSYLVCLILLCCTLIDVCLSKSDVNYKLVNNKTTKADNFLVIDHLNDNEKETRLKWKDLMGKETTLDVGENERFVNR